MLLRDQEVPISNEKCTICYNNGNLIMCNIPGCHVTRADCTKLFYLLKDRIKSPTIITIVCNVTEMATACARKYIAELKEQYPDYRIIITGCINELVEDKFKRLGTIIYKKDMWEIKNYE